MSSKIKVDTIENVAGSGAGTNRANIQNANNAGIHVCVGTSGSVTFTNSGYVDANALAD